MGYELLYYWGMICDDVGPTPLGLVYIRLTYIYINSRYNSIEWHSKESEEPNFLFSQDCTGLKQIEESMNHECYSLSLMHSAPRPETLCG